MNEYNLSEKPSEKILYLEVIRIIAIFSVILLHCNSQFFTNANMFESKTWWLTNLINAISRFGVPLFFMISGYLLLSSKTADHIELFYRKRFLKILPPFLIWSFIYYYNNCIIYHVPFRISNFLIRMGTQNVIYHFWYLYTILFFYLLTPFIKKIISQCNQKQLYLFLFIIILPTTICPFLNRLLQNWCFYLPMVVDGYWGFFLLGYLLGTYDLPKKYRKILYGAAVLCVLIAILDTARTSSSAKIDIFYTGGYQYHAFIISAAIFLFLKHTIPVVKNKLLSSTITTLGNLSFGLYLCHVLLIEKLSIILPISKAYEQIILYAIITFVLGYVVLYFVSKIKFLNKILL